MIVKCISDLVLFNRNEPEYSEEETSPTRILRGNPLQRTWHHFTSDDGKFFAGIWEADPGCWTINYTENEFCQILAGRSILRDGEGNEMEVSSGDNFTIPAGFFGEWDVIETTKKIYVIYQP